MLDKLCVQCWTSSPSQCAIDYPGCPHLSSCGSHEPDTSKNGHGSFDECCLHYPLELSKSASIVGIDLWLLKGPPCGSLPSTSSPISHSDSVPTPSDTGLPTYATVDSPCFQHVRSLANSEAWPAEPDPRRGSGCPGIPTWCSQEFSLPYHSGPACDQTPLQSVQDYILQPGPLTSPAYIPYHASVRYTITGVVELAPFQQQLASTPGVSDEDSDSASQVSDSDDEISSHNSPHSTSQRSNVMKFGKWAITYSSSDGLQPGHYQCPLTDKEHPESQCPKRYQRPEHLRRHVKTVHSNVKYHFCKVCGRGFSRCDNLRDHYWTHLDRGGRPGKNRKMKFSKLKAILGPKERQLVKRLRLKQNKVRAKLAKAKS